LVKTSCKFDAARYLFNGKFNLSKKLELRLSVDVPSREKSQEIRPLFDVAGNLEIVAACGLKALYCGLEQTSYLSLHEIKCFEG
jgi:hypothetical protein